MKIIVKSIMFLSFLNPSFAKSAWDQSGKISLGYQSFYKNPEPLPENYQSSGLKFEVEPSLQWSNSKNRIKFKALLGYDASFANPKDRILGIPQELFWERQIPKNNFLIGINTFNWGVTDIINPLDVLNTNSYRSILMPKKIGSPSLAWTHSRDQWSVELVYIPLQFPPQLPGEGSRFFPQGESLQRFAEQMPRGSNQSLLLPPAGIRYHYQNSELYDDPFRNNAGLKIRWNQNQLEAQIIGFEGHPGLPNLDPRASLIPYDLSDPANEIFLVNSDFDIVPQYQRIRMGGLGVVFSADSFILKFAHAQVFQTSSNLNQTRPGVALLVAQPKTTILALEKPFGFKSLENTFLLQAISQTDPHQDRESALSTRSIYDGGLLFGLRTASALDWSSTFGILVNPKASVQLFSYDLNYRWNDRFHVQLSGQHLSGREGTLVNSISYASSTQLNIISTW